MSFVNSPNDYINQDSMVYLKSSSPDKKEKDQLI